MKQQGFKQFLKKKEIFPENVAGVAPYRFKGNSFQIFMVHPGGPYFWKKPNVSWGFAKGHVEKGEDIKTGAVREFEEETGMKLKRDWPIHFVGKFTMSRGKNFYLWAVEGDGKFKKSNLFELEWPPNSGKIEEFPEIDRGEWIDPTRALSMVAKSQRSILEELILQLTEMLDSRMRK